jgi:hypothetical protein
LIHLDGLKVVNHLHVIDRHSWRSHTENEHVIGDNQQRNDHARVSAIVFFSAPVVAVVVTNAEAVSARTDEAINPM